MAQQSARRDQENQGFPPCLEHALGDLDRIRELPYRPAAARRRTTGRTDGSIRLRVKNSRIHSCAEGGVHRWKADIPAMPQDRTLTLAIRRITSARSAADRSMRLAALYFSLASSRRPSASRARPHTRCKAPQRGARSAADRQVGGRGGCLSVHRAKRASRSAVARSRSARL